MSSSDRLEQVVFLWRLLDQYLFEALFYWRWLVGLQDTVDYEIATSSNPSGSE